MFQIALTLVNCLKLPSRMVEQKCQLVMNAVIAYVVDHNLINTSEYHVILNPKNLDISEVDCDAEIEDERKSMLSEFNPKVPIHKCTLEKFKEIRFFDNMIRNMILGEL
ncbi:CLUMA_CG012068, isoform A, partial [Clunio marinus]